MNSLKFLLSYFLICSLNVNSQVLVKDLNPGTGNSVEDYGTKTLQIDEKIFFIASVNGSKQGLYVLKNNSIELLKEMCDYCDSKAQLFKHNEKLYFSTKENGKHKIFQSDGTKDNTKLVIEYGDEFNSSTIISTATKLYFDERNVGIHVLESGIDKIIPDTRFLELGPDSSPDRNRALIEGDKLLLITKTASDTVALLEITDKVVRLGKVKVDFGPDSHHGLKKVKNGYIFVYKEKLFNYKTSNKTITLLNLNAIKGSILTVLDFKLNQPILYVYNDGIFVIDDAESVAVTKISDIWDSVVQGTEFAKAYYGDKMLLLTDDYNTSFKSYALLTDGTTSGTFANKINAYPSSLIQKDQHVFFAAGILNGFEPSIYYFDMTKTAPAEIKAFTESSKNLTSIIPIGLIGSKLYYFSNLDAKYGRELYYIETGIKTKTEDLEDNIDYFTLKSKGNSFIVYTLNNVSEQLEITILDVNGKVIKTLFQNTGEFFDIPNINQMVIITVKSKLSKKQGVFKAIVF